MPSARIEHGNLTVTDLQQTAHLLGMLFGWHERWRGPSQIGRWTIHVGTQSDHVALYAHDGEQGSHPEGRPFNHLGVEVDDLVAVQARVVAAGLTPFNHADYKPGRRFYVFDPDGIEHEVATCST